MQVAGIRRIGDRAERIEVGELRPLTDDWVLLTVTAGLLDRMTADAETIDRWERAIPRRHQ